MSSKAKALIKLLGQCLKSDAEVFRTRVFVGLANFLPNFNTISTFVRPLLLRLAGARVAYPATIHRPLFIYYAGELIIERYAFINQGVRMEGRKTIRIGEGSLIGPFCCIENVNHRPEGSEELPVIIGKGAWIGGGSILLPGAEVGDGAVVAAGSVVRGRVAPHELWGGVPARSLRKLNQEKSAVVEAIQETEPLPVGKG
ncbi:MAG TPA: acyltransferase [Pyrinomonadaceae bacterium]|jgi:acetyltransferase-like isoleucine patch superfamily enzyme